MDWTSLQQQWDSQQQAYLPDREDRLGALLDVVQAACGPAPRVLDLAAGTGSITRRLLSRLPGASAVLVDVDPALLAIAAGTFAGDQRVGICRANLATSGWRDALGESDGSFNAVVSATALHWLTPDRVAGVYHEAGALLSAGGVLANADHMGDEGLASLSASFQRLVEARSAGLREQTGALDWDGWWTMLRNQPELAALVAERDEVFRPRDGSSHTESELPSSWHIAALQAAGFRHAGVAWRALNDALVVGIRA
ncbi:MAG: class I SAM-dependent methyltransferase [Candidatus Dormibacteria bacterium]